MVTAGLKCARDVADGVGHRQTLSPKASETPRKPMPSWTLWPATTLGARNTAAKLRSHNRRTPRARRSPRPRRRAAPASREYACPISSTVRAGRRGPRWDHCPAARGSAQDDSAKSGALQARSRGRYPHARRWPGRRSVAPHVRAGQRAPDDGEGADAARGGPAGSGVVTRPPERCYSYAIAERQARSIRSLLTKERGI